MTPIPAKALEQHIAILGKTGSGKTYAAKGAVEGILSAHGRACVIDPTGAWHGLRSSASGKKAGFPVVIFGGRHGDLPLGAAHGEALGEIVGTSNTPTILDTSLMKVKERTRFFTDFAETLAIKNRGPLHLIIDEAHVFAPQGKVNDPQSGAMLHAANNLVSLGRGLGLRIILISQRPAKLHKDSLTQIETLIAFRLIAPQDRKAVEEWIKDNADEAQGREIIRSLAVLKTGEGWIWAPELNMLERVTFPKIKTFDSSAAPDGSLADGPVLAPIDKETIAAQLDTVAKDALANDPSRLKAQVATLTREVAILRSAPAVMKDPHAERRGYDRGHAEAMKDRAVYCATLQTLQGDAKDLLHSIETSLTKAYALGKRSAAPAENGAKKTTPVTLPAKERGVAKDITLPDGGYTGPQKRVISSLAMWAALGHVTPSREMVAATAGYSPSSGGFKNLLGSLNTMGAISYPSPGNVELEAINVAPLSADEGARMLWGHLSNSQKKIVLPLLDSPLQRDVLADAAGYSASSGGFKNLLGSLRTLGIIDYPAPGSAEVMGWAKELLGGMQL